MDANLKRKLTDKDDDIKDKISSLRANKKITIIHEDIETFIKENEEKERKQMKKVEVEMKEVKPTRGRGKAGPSKIKTKIMIKKSSEEELMAVAKEELSLPQSTRSRLRKLKIAHSKKMKEIKEENAQVLALDIFKDDMNKEIVDETKTPEKSTELSLKVQYLGIIKKVKCDQTEKFSSIFVKVADAFDLKASEILLCHKDVNIQVDNTPSSLNIKFYDLIECLPYKAEKKETEVDYNQIQVKIQSNDSKKKIEMTIHRLASMQDVMVRYAKLRNIPLTRMEFKFDGEKIEGAETPEDLEMESGSCINVKITAEKPQEDMI